MIANTLAATTGVIGALIIYGASEWLPVGVPYILAFAAGNFLYVAMADLIPGLHRGTIDVSAVRQGGLISAGIATVVAF